ncbi:YitT family membrane protein [Ligilactobacillus salitolerans]|uniref:YitT family membrane protein n=1 Tax=Ligilactobacillus salitolerans TaxID=1808352 RepID=A0A401ITY7_9LACO|nr:YitT family protein [Ligilactobacillus salitolerans]GBG95010.1 YitT family membrane protein [Ligilactobacillus salitolerans]
MDELQRIWKRHAYLMRISTAFMYGIIVSIAMNFFWTPGHIYSSGITGLAQLLATLCKGTALPISAALWLFVLNVPLFFLAWKQIGHRFTIFTFLAVIFSSIMIKVIQPLTLTHDPIICAIFGGAVNGFGTGLALKNGISTGGLDIMGLTVKKHTGKSIGTINMAFNAFIVVAAGFMFGWPYAFYSALGLVVNARVMDMVYTRQKKMQVMIVTARPNSVIESIQTRLRRGVTIVHGVEGAYKHDAQTILFTIISQYEQSELERAMHEADQHAFVSIAENVHIMGHFYEPEP